MQNYDIIKNALSLLTNENTVRMIILELELVEFCFLKDLSSFDYESEKQADQIEVELTFLDQFE